MDRQCLSSFLVEAKCTFYNVSFPNIVYFLQSVLFLYSTSENLYVWICRSACLIRIKSARPFSLFIVWVLHKCWIALPISDILDKKRT